MRCEFLGQRYTVITICEVQLNVMIRVKDFMQLFHLNEAMIQLCISHTIP